MLMQVKMIGLLITCNLTQHNITEHDLIPSRKFSLVYPWPSLFQVRIFHVFFSWPTFNNHACILFVLSLIFANKSEVANHP